MHRYKAEHEIAQANAMGVFIEQQKSKLRIGDKVSTTDENGKVYTLGRIVERGYTAKNRSYDFGVDLAVSGMSFIAGFDEDELEKIVE